MLVGEASSLATISKGVNRGGSKTFFSPESFSCLPIPSATNTAAMAYIVTAFEESFGAGASDGLLAL